MARTKQLAEARKRAKHNKPDTGQKGRLFAPVNDPVELGNRRRKAKRTMRHKAIVYRKLASQAGYIGGFGNSLACGKDQLSNLLSTHDVRRLIRFRPACTPSLFDNEQQQAARDMVLTESLPPSVLKAARPHVEAVFRDVMNSAVEHALETGRLRVSAACLTHAVQKYTNALSFNGAFAPKQLLLHAMQRGVIPAVANTAAVLHVETNAAVDTECDREEYKQAVRKKARKTGMRAVAEADAAL